MIVKLLVNLPRQAEKEPDSLVYLREIRVENNEQGISNRSSRTHYN